MDGRGFTNDQIRDEFIKATVLGSLLIVFMVVLDTLNLLFSGALQILLKIAPPVILMSIYWFRYLHLRQGSQYEYEFADSFYYMGFIFTLWSLLLSFTWGALTGEGGDQNSIIGNLGVALATTIYGLSVRVAYVSFETNAETTQDQLNKDLQRSSTLLSLHVERIVNELDLLAKTRFKPLSETTELLTNSLSSLNPKFSEMESGVVKTHQAILDLESSSREATDGFTGLNSSAAELSHSISGVGQAADIAGDGFTILSERVSGISESLMSSVSAQLESIKTVGTSLEQVVVQVTAIASTVGATDLQLKAAFSSLEVEIQRNKAAWSTQTSALHHLANEVEPAKLAFSEMAGSLAEMQKSLLAISTLASSITTIQLDINKVSETDFYRIHKEALDRIVSTSRTFSESFENIERLNKTISDYSGKSAAMLSEVETRLIQNLRDLNAQIKNQ